MADNTLYYGDNLDILKRYIKDESVDLIYLDPPFNSNASYNVLFKEQDGHRAQSQIQVFEDTWEWNLGAEAAYKNVVEAGGQVSIALQAFRNFLGESDMMAYLAMMAPRLQDMKRVLKPTGSIYLHCDPTASHYLKVLMDAVFGPEAFLNEIIWKRTSGHSDARRQFADQTDVLLFYRAGPENVFKVQYLAYSEKYVTSHYSSVDENGRRYTTRDLRSPHPRPNLTYEYKGYKPHPNGWSVSLARMKELDAQGLLYFPASKEGRIRIKRYLDEMPGSHVGNLWDDISPINSQAQERLGYPTQKPEALLERIILASSNEGDLILDPFCGCGTAIAAAQKTNRKWIGIDITYLAVSLMKHRLQDAFGDAVTYKVVGEPVSLPDAQRLAEQDKYQFQWWSLGLVHARPVGQKKGADKGIDGRLFFHDEGAGGKTKQVILSVKAGHTGPDHVRDLKGVLDREKAEIGVLITMQEPTHPMKEEAASTGFYESPGWKKSYPKLQLLTIEELLKGKQIAMPPLGEVNVTFKKAQKAEKKSQEHRELSFNDEDE